jgi:peptide alpha-N-acetyltransferase
MELNLSEPYPIYTYRYFVQKWPELCFLAMYEGECIGCVVSKLENQRKKDSALVRYRGYIAMLAVDPTRRRCGLGRKLVQISIDAMKKANADEVILETELENQAALNLYHCKYFVIFDVFCVSDGILERQKIVVLLFEWK